MINNANDIGFIHDIAGLDKLRQNAVSDKDDDQKAALKAAAKQFESIFTTMLFKSMRDANSTFQSDLMNTQNQDFYRQMLDEQMASEMSSSGSLGLADMIVAQLGAASGESETTQGAEQGNSEIAMRNAAFNTTLRLPVDQSKAPEITNKAVADNATIDKVNTDKTPAVTAVGEKSDPIRFDSPEQFVESMKPYAKKAAKVLGIEPAILIAQAALETGWGKKVIKNAQGSSNNLFNIKADRRWQGDKMSTQTLEFYDNVAVKEKAAFRAYNSYEESFNDFVSFLKQNPRYKTALSQKGSSEDFIRGIHKAGYATDPKYVEKVLSVKKRIDKM